MTIQPVASRRPSLSARGPAGRRRIRAAAAIAAVAALIATGGYVAITRVGPDAATPTAATTTDNPSAQTLRDMVQSVAGQYGSRFGAVAVVNAGAQTLRELHESIAGQYGSQSEPESTVNPNAQVGRELRHSIAGQYGPAAR